MTGDTQTGPFAALLSTGEEVLRGEILDTNNHYLASTLGEHGFDIQLMLTVGDRPEDLRFAITSALLRADYVFMSGGLGPTEDDLTTTVAAELAGRKLIFDEASWQAIVALFRKYNMEAGTNNKKQAMLPEGADILANHNGTAPGFSLAFDYQGQNKTLIALPGPPRELQPMLRQWLEARDYRAIPPEEHLFLRFVGIGESPLAEALEPWTKQWGDVSFRQDFPEMEVKLYRPSQQKRLSLCEFAKDNLQQYLTSYSRLSVPGLFDQFMRQSGNTLAVAESLTGGHAAKVITDNPGSSGYFLGGLVSAADTQNTSISEALTGGFEPSQTASGDAAEKMALHARQYFNADLSLSFSGIAGPDGGTVENPVGTAWIARTDAQGSQSKKLFLMLERDRIRSAAVYRGLHFLMEDWLKDQNRKQLEQWRAL